MSPSLTALFLSLSDILSHVALPVLHRLLLHALSFPYPATLLLLHHITVALSLFFWTLFGVFHPLRRLPPAALVLTFLPATLLPMLTLHRTSLALAHAARLLSAALSHFLLRRAARASPPLLLALAATLLLARLDGHAALLPLLTAAALSLHAHVLRRGPAPPHTHLQLHLPLRVLAAALLLPLLPLLDDCSPASPASLLRLAWLDAAPPALIAAALLAFFAFVARRAARLALHPASFAANRHLVSCAVFAAHFVLLGHELDTPRAAAVAVVVAVAAFVRSADDARDGWKESEGERAFAEGDASWGEEDEERPLGTDADLMWSA